MTSIEALINRQFLRWEQQHKEREQSPQQPPPPLPIVTVSRQTGSRGSYFASRLAQKLEYQRIHREIIDAICASSGHRKRIIESLDERSRSAIDVLAEAFVTGASVDHSDYRRHLAQVVLSMSRLGGVVLVGRGGNLILGPTRGFHIRVICPREKRITNLMTYKGLSADDAGAAIDKSDDERRRFIRKLNDADIDDPRHYDLVINAANIDVEEMVSAVVEAIRGKMDKLAHPENDPG